MSYDLYAWKAPRDLEPDEAQAMLKIWSDEGADPSASPFEPSSDIGWFYRELMMDLPELDASSDAAPDTSTAPAWAATVARASQGVSAKGPSTAAVSGR